MDNKKGTERHQKQSAGTRFCHPPSFSFFFCVRVCAKQKATAATGSRQWDGEAGGKKRKRPAFRRQALPQSFATPVGAKRGGRRWERMPRHRCADGKQLRHWAATSASRRASELHWGSELSHAWSRGLRRARADKYAHTRLCDNVSVCRGQPSAVRQSAHCASVSGQNASLARNDRLPAWLRPAGTREEADPASNGHIPGLRGTMEAADLGWRGLWRARVACDGEPRLCSYTM